MISRYPAVPARLRNLLLLIATMAVAVPLVLTLRAPRISVARHRPAQPQRVVPPAELPAVEPVTYEAIAPEDAQAFNATIPFVAGPNPPARPFRFAGDGDQLERATDCLAAAVLYEAGNDPEGQRAVAQVILNRVRHPAFPKTVCGVVFQGSERSTGCQFTFTCDGALTRNSWSADSWSRARAISAQALRGTVDAAVGLATHYHTDWVVPYWSSSLDKIAAVHTHLFFRWTGWWGTPPAFDRHPDPAEPAIAALAPFSPAHAVAAALEEVGAANGEAATSIVTTTGDAPMPIATDPDAFVVLLDRHASADAFAAVAARACGARPYCKFMGWVDRAKLPTALPLQAQQIATMSFSYLRDRAHNYDKALWNCAEFRRADVTQCMRIQVLLPAGSEVVLPGGAATPPAASGGRVTDPAPSAAEHLPIGRGLPVPPADLGGVRRRPAPAPSPTPSPTSIGR